MVDVPHWYYFDKSHLYHLSTPNALIKGEHRHESINNFLSRHKCSWDDRQERKTSKQRKKKLNEGWWEHKSNHFHVNFNALPNISCPIHKPICLRDQETNQNIRKRKRKFKGTKNGRKWIENSTKKIYQHIHYAESDSIQRGTSHSTNLLIHSPANCFDPSTPSSIKTNDKLIAHDNQIDLP